MKAGDALAEAKDTSVTQASTDLNLATDKIDAEMKDLKTTYDAAMLDMKRTVTENVEKDKFRTDYNAKKSGKDKGYRYNTAGKIESEGYTTDTTVDIEAIDFDSFTTNPESPTTNIDSIPTMTINDKRFNGKGAFFGTIRAKDGNQTCFIGSTKILMGGNNG